MFLLLLLPALCLEQVRASCWLECFARLRAVQSPDVLATASYLLQRGMMRITSEICCMLAQLGQADGLPSPRWCVDQEEGRPYCSGMKV